jgi:transposase-like protein
VRKLLQHRRSTAALNPDESDRHRKKLLHNIIHNVQQLTWMSVLSDLRNRGIKDVFFVVCDGLKGLP